MKFWKKILNFIVKKDDIQTIPEDPIKIFSDDKERLIYTEEKSRSADTSILTRTSNIPSTVLNTYEVFPKKCLNCPDHKNYLEGEIHQCPDCGQWICGRHYHGHVLKKHGSQEYRVQSNEIGQGNYKFPK